MSKKGKISKDLVKRFITSVGNGSTYINACHACGVTQTLFHTYWKPHGHKVEAYVNAGGRIKKDDSIVITGKDGRQEKIFNCSLKLSLVIGVRKAEAAYIDKLTDTINHNAIDLKDSKTAMWMLERKDRYNFGDRKVVSIDNNEDKPFKTDVSNDGLTKELLELRELTKDVALGKDLFLKYGNNKEQ